MEILDQVPVRLKAAVGVRSRDRSARSTVRKEPAEVEAFTCEMSMTNGVQA